jgi:hypothetical protein
MGSVGAAVEKEGFSDNLPEAEVSCGVPDPMSGSRVSRTCIPGKQEREPSERSASADKGDPVLPLRRGHWVRSRVGRRADQVMVSSRGFAFSADFCASPPNRCWPRHCCRPRRLGRQVHQLHPYLTDDASCGLANGNLVGNFDLWRGIPLPPFARTGHCVCGRILPATKTVGQALSSQNVSNRTTS